MIAENINRIKATLPAGARLVAVSKLKPVEDIMEAYRAGQRLFGENYATELRDKHAQLPQDIEWHFIGHLQSKQLKYYIQFVSLIHGVDSLEHLHDVDAAAAKAGRVVDVLLQVHVAQEETKFGFAPEELERLPDLQGLEHVRVCGLMAMASHTTDESRIRADFHAAQSLFRRLKDTAFARCDHFRELSMGMSHDYPLALEEGSTLVRIGSSIFGARDYSKKPF
ncbi:MAG: YggS family pyridoxal phosphate-dependent enzyme [Bacteroidales bacterium]|nr:YggS family pyridoxal phosphate-dependent enzyme [Bacteroidales bacterium]